MRILLDMDGVVVDFVKPLLDLYNGKTGESVQLSSIKTYSVHKYVKDPGTLKQLKDSVGFIRSLPPKGDAIDGVKELLKAGHDIAFVSNGTNCPTSGHEKRDWLQYYFHREWQYPPLVLTYHKYLVSGDCLVDDDPRNFKNLSEKTTPLLWHCSYNSEVAGFTKIYDWSHLLDWANRN